MHAQGLNPKTSFFLAQILNPKTSFFLDGGSIKFRKQELPKFLPANKLAPCLSTFQKLSQYQIIKFKQGKKRNKD
jgi:hypothetical protein